MLSHKKYIRKLCFMDLPPSQRQHRILWLHMQLAKQIQFFISNPCKVTSFEVTTPKMELSSPSIGVALVRPSKFRFKNRKVTTNKSSRVLLSYFATICIILSHPTNVFITSIDLKCGSNISANML